MNTILTTQLFNQYCNDYYLTNKTNALNNSITTTLPTTIKNVELSLNTMTNGKLYKQYNPNNLKFNGVGNLDASAEQDTLYSLLTEAVLYRIQTGAFVNVSNTFGGNITGLNHFSASNSNVIGLRNDIRDKLVALQLYKNANYTNPTVNQPPQLLNDKPLTIQQAAAINNWLSTNNFTLGGSWNFANLNIDGVNITQFIQNQLSTQGNDYSEVLINYLPKTQIPLITTNDIQNINNNSNSIQSLSNSVFDNTNKCAQYDAILSNYLSGNNQVPMITSANITNWNKIQTIEQNIASANNDFNIILQNYLPQTSPGGSTTSISTIPLITQAQITTWNTYQGILSNYSGGSSIPSITTQDISNWNNTNQDLSNVMDVVANVGVIVSNYSSAIPLITQADINKWNNNTQGSGGSVNITKQVYTLTITNNWTVEYSNGSLVYNGSTLNISPSLPSGLDISITATNGSIGSTAPTINLIVSGKTIISSTIYGQVGMYNNNQYFISPIPYMSLSTTDGIQWSINANCQPGYWDTNYDMLAYYPIWQYYANSNNQPYPLINNTFALNLEYSLSSSKDPSTFPANSTLQEPMTLYLELVYC